MTLIVDWHWIVAGIALMLFELIIPSFFALWFGAGAVIVGVTLFFVPTTPIAVQVLLWTIVSSGLTWLWFKHFKPKTLDSDIAPESVTGEVGQILTPPSKGRPGKLRFSAPLLGLDEWACSSEDDLHSGDRIRVIGVSDKTLIVEKHESQ